MICEPIETSYENRPDKPNRTVFLFIKFSTKKYFFNFIKIVFLIVGDVKKLLYFWSGFYLLMKGKYI